MQFCCWKCGETLDVPATSRVLNRDTCPKCDSDLHCCRNCQLYDPGKHNQCSETQADWVRDKEAANYCDYFQPNPARRASAHTSGSKADDARNKFDSLFKI